MAQNHDLVFLARQWENVELPKEKKYLLRYFRTPLQAAFLKYVHLFGSHENFVDHTGLACSLKWRELLYNRLQKIEALHREARANPDIEQKMKDLAHIESGKFKL